MSNPSLLRLGEHITCVPVIHGRSVFAQEVRRIFLDDQYQCVAVELPHSLSASVLEAVEYLPYISAVVYQEPSGQYCYVPVEPSDSIIEAIRLAVRERAVVEFVDLEIEDFPRATPPLPDEYAVRLMGLETYYQAVQSILPMAAQNSIQDQRERWMAAQLRQLDSQFHKILFVCGLAHLEGIIAHFNAGVKPWPTPRYEVQPCIYSVHSDSLYFLMGEIPYLTYLYEKCRASLDLTEFDKTDGIKELMLESRQEFCRDFPDELDRLTPSNMQIVLSYMRNLCLVHGRLTPMLYEVVVAAQGVGGGAFGAQVVEMSKFYPYLDPTPPYPLLRMGIDQGHLEGIGVVPLKSRLPGPPIVFRNIRLERKPRSVPKEHWKTRWNPYTQCSWPEEDERIENFTAHIRQRARGLLGEDQVRIEKFTCSIKDGLDMRETMRQWHTGDIYVKEMPAVRGEVGSVIFIFDTQSENYPWRATWHAEHCNESTLCFYATDFHEDLVGPGIGRAYYGGALFIFPPQPIPDIWTDPRFDEYPDPVERTTIAGLHYSKQRYVAYVANQRPSIAIRRAARRLDRHLIFLPLSNFSAYTVRKLRKFHVLQGKDVRSYARDYIR